MKINNTLINRIDTIKEAGIYYKNSNILKDRRLEIEKFTPLIDDLLIKFNNMERDYKALKKIYNDSNIDFSAIKSQLYSLKENIHQDMYDKILVIAIRKDIEKIQNQMFNFWNSYINLKTSAIDTVLNSLGNLITDLPEKSKLQEKRNLIRSSTIGNPKAMKAIEEYIILYNDVINKLNLKDNIITFLNLLASGKRVTFDDIDEEIYNWIKNHNFSKKIIIKII